MDNDRRIWLGWANILQRWGLGEWTASLLEAAGPLSLFGAQMVYIAQPFLGGAVGNSRLTALSRLLEDTEAVHAFVACLREGRT